MAQWKRAGPITQRSVDRNHALLGCFVSIAIRCLLGVASKIYRVDEFTKHVLFFVAYKGRTYVYYSGLSFTIAPFVAVF